MGVVAAGLVFGVRGVGGLLASIAAVSSLSALADMLMFYPAGILLDKWGRKWGGIPSLLFSLGLTLLPFAAGYGEFAMVALVIGVGIQAYRLPRGKYFFVTPFRQLR